MKSTIFCFLLVTLSFCFADTNIPAGNVSGVWSFSNSPYIIDGEISIQSGDELTIEPGTEIIFSGHYKFNVYGRILAVGTETDSIFFTAQDMELGWHSLRFWNTSSNGQDSSKVVYCDIRLGKASGEGEEQCGGAIYCDNSSNLLIADCLIMNNYAESHGGGIHCTNSSPNLINVTIAENSVEGEWITYGGGLSCTSNSNPTLENVTISDNVAHNGASAYGGGIYCSSSNPILTNFTISENTTEGYDTYGGGIYLTNSNPILAGGTISGNYNDTSESAGGGIFCDNSSSPSLEDIVISGNYAHYGGGISCSSNSNPSLENITISGNTGVSSGGGIYCIEASPNLDNVIIIDNFSYSQGGGIYLCSNSNPVLTNVNINNNVAEGYSSSRGGGGIYCSNSNLVLVNATISGNSVLYDGSDGGGIYCKDNSNMNLENVTISGNSAYEFGGGIYCSASNLNFNLENRCNLYSNICTNSRGYGVDLFADNCDFIEVIVDTFTVFSPTDYYASPIDNFSFDLLNSVEESLINSDVYVSVEGNNSNSGTSPESPFKTINFALSRIFSDSLTTNTIHLNTGIYSQSTNGENYPLKWSNYVNLSGTGENDTILEADSTSGVIAFVSVSNAFIENLTITGGSAHEGGGIYCSDYSSPSFKDIIITGNSADNGGGICCKDYSSPSFENIAIIGNSAQYWGGGIYCHNYSNPSFINVEITDNSATGYLASGGGICCNNNSNPSLINVTVSTNTAIQPGGVNGKGGGIICRGGSSPSLLNCIFWDNYPHEIYFLSASYLNSISVSYSDIQGGEADVVTNNNGIVNWLEGNIDADPIFFDPANGDYHLAENSPCIDAGDPNSIFDPDGTVADLGAYYYEQSVSGQEEEIQAFIVDNIRNYPNPFNPSGSGRSPATTIEFSVQKDSEIDLSIYNVKGQKVKTLSSQSYIRGIYSVNWDGDDKSGKAVSSGIYYYKLNVNGKTESVKKCLLLK